MDLLESDFPEDEVDKYNKIVEEFKSKGYIGSQFNYLLEVYFKIRYIEGKNSIENVDEKLPTPWYRPSCTYCHRPMPGVIVSDRYGWSARILKAENWRHFECFKL
jgi:hypothetical protein